MTVSVQLGSCRGLKSGYFSLKFTVLHVLFYQLLMHTERRHIKKKNIIMMRIIAVVVEVEESKLSA